MKNITQQQRDAKQAYLANQQVAMLAHYKQTGPTERAAIIKQVDSFLPAFRSNEERIFWLRFRYRLERMSDSRKVLEATQ